MNELQLLTRVQTSIRFKNIRNVSYEMYRKMYEFEKLWGQNEPIMHQSQRSGLSDCNLKKKL